MAKLYDTTGLPEYYSILCDTKRRFEMKMPIVTMKLPYHLSLFCHILFAQSLDCIRTHGLTPIILFCLSLNLFYSLITLEYYSLVIILITFHCLAPVLDDKLKFSTNLFTLPLRM